MRCGQLRTTFQENPAPLISCCKLSVNPGVQHKGSKSKAAGDGVSVPVKRYCDKLQSRMS